MSGTRPVPDLKPAFSAVKLRGYGGRRWLLFIAIPDAKPNPRYPIAALADESWQTEMEQDGD